MTEAAGPTLTAELKLEDFVTEVLKQVGVSLDKTQEQVEENKGKWSEWASSAAQNLHNLGINVTDVASKVYEFGKSFVTAAAGGEKADFAIAGMLSSVQGKSFEDAIDEAKGLGDALDEIAVRSGAVGDVGAAFERMVEFTGASASGIDRAKSSIDDLSQISRVLGKDVGAISQEYALMTEGVIRTKGQLFQLIQSTGVFGSKSKEVAANWSKLSEEKRLEILDSAIGKIGDKFAAFPQSYDNLTTSLQKLGDVAKEEVGEPFMQALQPAVQDLINTFQDIKPDIIELAQAMGSEMGEWVKMGTKEMKQGLQFLKDHRDDMVEIGKAVREGWSVAKQVVEFILAHKDEIAIAFGAKMLGSGIGALASQGADLRKAFADLPSAMNKNIDAINAWTVVIGAAVLAGKKIADEYSELEDASYFGKSNELARTNALQQAAQGGQVEKIKAMRATQESMSGPVGLSEAEMMNYKNALDLAEMVADATARLHDSYKNKLADGSKAVGDALRASGQMHYEASSSYADRVLEAQVSKIVQAYNSAIQMGDIATATYAANMLTGSVQLQEAFLQSGLTISGGIDQFAQMLYSKSDTLASGLAALAGKDKLGGKTSKNMIVMPGGTGSGNVNINVNQNFRNDNPDRVALAFRRDIYKAAEHRFQSGFVSPWG